MKKLLVLGVTLVFALIVLAPNAHGQGPPPPPPPGGGPTATPTSTPLPTATATPIPLTLNVRLAHGTVKAGQTQKVTVSTLAGAGISLSVAYPSGNKDSVSGSANGSGQLTYSFTQPGGMSRGSNRTVKVKVAASFAGQSKGSTKKYKIG